MKPCVGGDVRGYQAVTLVKPSHGMLLLVASDSTSYLEALSLKVPRCRLRCFKESQAENRHKRHQTV